MGGRDTNSFCLEFPKVTHENMLFTTFNNAQMEDWQKIDGNGNLAYNEIFHYHNNPPKFTRKIKYGKHTRKEIIHKIQIGPNAIMVVHTKDVSYTPIFRITSY